MQLVTGRILNVIGGGAPAQAPAPTPPSGNTSGSAGGAGGAALTCPPGTSPVVVSGNVELTLPGGAGVKGNASVGWCTVIEVPKLPPPPPPSKQAN